MENVETTKEKYRKRSVVADNVSEIQHKLAVITHKPYMGAIGLTDTGVAHLEPLVQGVVSNLNFVDGKICKRTEACDFFSSYDNCLSSGEIMKLCTLDYVDKIDLTLLRMLYTVILHDFELSGNTHLEDTYTIYVPDLLSAMGMQSNQSAAQIKTLISNIGCFSNLIGIIHNEGYPDSWYPLLNLDGYDGRTNTISFNSPYIKQIVERMYSDANRLAEEQKLKKATSVKPKIAPTHSYLIKPEISKERNLAAVENVYIIVTLIEQCGDRLPHISAQTLYNRNPYLQKRLSDCDAKNRSKILKRTFSKTWQLLETMTNLRNVYDGIIFPDPMDAKNIPKYDHLASSVYEFRHNGKIRND